MDVCPRDKMEGSAADLVDCSDCLAPWPKPTGYGHLIGRSFRSLTPPSLDVRWSSQDSVQRLVIC